ncbi:hypothetical protein CRM22_007577 [Opisthorchis felineus]|uniref:WH1 domain-containing protein n=1 Tax=Opisthorchis felineus TaxID=147828 RepID=A0A4S2LFP3_OPIFE|nr:hypothetical protein CRM22_007577 [Opisthorchis felineus]TGZ62190.1 hypothetical protein CRM22_007577 [Opisthorchis felineus]
MGELPVFTCQAHVFTINPKTKKSWIPSSTKAVDVNFFYDSNKHCYRIISVEDGSGGKKVVINSTLSEKMTFKKTSQKFGQWADPKTGSVHGLGFNSEMELTEFVNHFKQYVEASKGSPCTSTSSNGREHEALPPAMNGHSQTVGQSTILSTSHGQPMVAVPPGAMNSITHTTMLSPPMSLSSPFGSTTQPDTGPHSVYLPQTSLQLQQQLKQAQAQVRLLEAELNVTKLQVTTTIGNNTSSETGSVSDTTKNPGRSTVETPTLEQPNVAELQGCISGLELNGSLINGAGEEFTTTELPSPPKPSYFIPAPPTASKSRGFWIDHTSGETLRSLHTRLGYILREAVELHARLGALLPHGTPGAPPE